MAPPFPAALPVQPKGVQPDGARRPLVDMRTFRKEAAVDGRTAREAPDDAKEPPSLPPSPERASGADGGAPRGDKAEATDDDLTGEETQSESGESGESV